MGGSSTRGRRSRSALAAAAVLALAGCSSGRPPGAATGSAASAGASVPATTAVPAAVGGTTPARTAGPTPATAAPGSPPPTGAGAAGSDLVQVEDVPGYGRILVDGEGHPLYVDGRDRPGEAPRCVGACRRTWLPVLSRSARAPAPTVALRLTVLRRPDGGVQLAYRGLALYRYALDPSSGAVTGAGRPPAWQVARYRG